MLETLIDGYCRLISYLIAALLAVMVVLVFGNVVMRYVFNSGFSISEELSRWLFVWLTFSSARWWPCAATSTWAPTCSWAGSGPPARRSAWACRCC